MDPAALNDYLASPRAESLTNVMSAGKYDQRKHGPHDAVVTRKNRLQSRSKIKSSENTNEIKLKESPEKSEKPNRQISPQRFHGLWLGASWQFLLDAMSYHLASERKLPSEGVVAR